VGATDRIACRDLEDSWPARRGGARTNRPPSVPDSRARQHTPTVRLTKDLGKPPGQHKIFSYHVVTCVLAAPDPGITPYDFDNELRTEDASSAEKAWRGQSESASRTDPATATARQATCHPGSPEARKQTEQGTPSAESR
jgi:hypothetical protein